MWIKPLQLGCSMHYWKEAKSKIDKVDCSEARNVLFNYTSEMETMGLPIAIEQVNLSVELVEKKAKKCRHVYQNCKHTLLRWEQCLHKFQTKISHDVHVALGLMNQEWPMINCNAMNLQLSFWFINFIW